MAEGAAPYRIEVMRNVFHIVGPESDPAQVALRENAIEAMRAIADARAPFASRGDGSGTHLRELKLWGALGLDPADFGSEWYRATGRGQGATLNYAATTGSYTLTDSATWATHGNREGLRVLVENGDELENIYGYMPVANGANVEGAERFGAWLAGPEGRAVIDGFRPAGERLFDPLGRLDPTSPSAPAFKAN